MTTHLSTSLKDVPGIGAIHQKRLERLGIKTMQDLVFHFPRRYEDFSRVVSISDIVPEEALSIHGVIRSIGVRRSWKTKRFITEALIEDDTGNVKVMWFNQPYLSRTLKKGTRVAIAGKASRDEKGHLVFVSPEFELESRELLHTSRLVPIYPETGGLSSKWLRWKIHSFLPALLDEVEEDLPDEVLERNALMPVREALTRIHFPASREEAKKARLCFSFSNLLHVRLRVLLERELRKREYASTIPFDKAFVQGLVKSLGFPLTQDQRRAAWEVFQDLEKPYPMQRLLEGDVGTGKTLVALLVSALSMHQGKQVALMAPTEILAAQHFETFTHLLRHLHFPIALVTRSMKRFYDPPVDHVRTLPAKDIKQRVKSGEIKLVIGTHALIQEESAKREGVPFSMLSLVIVDEQHRFGVEQRSQLLLSAKTRPHLLTMSATPIPRSLALTLYGNLQISFLKTFPKGARKIFTRVVVPLKRQSAYEFIREKVEQGHQVYVICPIIEESERIDTKAAIEEYEALRQKVFPEFRVGLLHGRMRAKEKEQVMKAFLERDISILVATSVVEVGVDVPGANIMIIEGAERFGLSQIHQLRGRIGRRGQVGYCLLFTNSQARATRARLSALMSSNDGFVLAEKDLAIRGPGELAGRHQAGMKDIGMEALGDSALVANVKEEADALIGKSPDLGKWPALQKRVSILYEHLHLE